MSVNCGTFHAPALGRAQSLCAKVLGMGWLSSVGVAQHLMREPDLRIPRPGAGPQLNGEVRRDCDLPIKQAASGGEVSWSGYMEDFDVAEAGEKDEVMKKVGEVHQWSQAIREAFEAWGIPRSEEKACCQRLEVERLGAALDGIAGRAHGSPKKASS